MIEERLLVWLLRLFGGVTCFAMFAALLPTDWMAATHAWLGIGQMPRGPVVEYLARSISLLYAAHGGVVVVASTDVRRFAPLITYLALADGTMGLLLLAVDAYAGLPWYWIAAEGPSAAITAVVLLWLNRRVQASAA